MLSHSPGQFRQADAILDAALDLEAEERTAFVDRACEGNQELRSLVLRLLRAFDRSDAFLSGAAVEMARPLLDGTTAPDAELTATMPIRVGPYVVLRELGRGGMGVVYLATREDDPAAVPVALKMLRGGALASGTVLRRFLAERTIVATLEHPFVARLLETGITPDGSPYFVMAYCPGGSLAERLTKRALPVTEALRVARQLAEALAAAHTLGVVHRDVKPANVMFSAVGEVQLTDFGVAKQLDQDSTHAGMLLGTPAYLAPEQLRGAAVDQRADLWALGVTLYEMLTQRKPFDGPSYAAVLHAVVAVDPEPVGRGASVPRAIDELLRHLLCKDPEGRPESAARVARALAAIEADPSADYGARVNSLEPRTTPSLRRPGASIVVLPFDNTTGVPDHAPFVDGLTDELISALSQVHGLRVTARTTAFALKRKGLDARAITNIIGAGFLLEGSVRRSGDRIKVTAQLVSADKASVVWSDTYDRRIEDIFAVQEELARLIVAALAPTLGRRDSAPVMARPRDVTTYELYLKGRYFWERRTTPDLERAVEYFSEALARDPSYAEAHAGLADAQILRAVLSNRPPAETLPLARAALAEALRIGSGIAVVHAAYGNLLSAFDWNWSEAEAQLQLAIELDAGLIIAQIYLAIYLQHVGRFDEAIDVATSALVLDPLSSGLNLTLGRAYLHARRPAEALQPLKTAVEIAPGLAFAHQQMGHALLQLGRSAEAIDAFRRAAMSGGPIDAGQLAFALATTGDRVAAEAVVRDLLAMEATGYLPPFAVVCAYAGLGELDAAFAWLNRGIDEHAAHMNTIRVVPALYPLHGDRRWRDVLARMGWPSPS